MIAMTEHAAGSRRAPAGDAIARAVALGILVVGAVLAVGAYRIQVSELPSPPDRALAVVLVAWSFLLSGAVVWLKRPATRLGPLMIVAGFALLARQLRYSHDPVLFTPFFAFGELGYAVVGHVILAYPAGRVTERGAERAIRLVLATRRCSSSRSPCCSSTTRRRRCRTSTSTRRGRTWSR